jgi:hypothetical protein
MNVYRFASYACLSVAAALLGLAVVAVSPERAAAVDDGISSSALVCGYCSPAKKCDNGPCLCATPGYLCAKVGKTCKCRFGG